MARPNVGIHSIPGMPNDIDLSNPFKAWRRRGSPEDRGDGEIRAWLTRRTWGYGQGIEGQTRPWPRMLEQQRTAYPALPFLSWPRPGLLFHHLPKTRHQQAMGQFWEHRVEYEHQRF